ncbi:hypothetical protein GGI07_001788 [Coemansia sp. Benny D115]|nr:hypothetical protein GGI07_001788 [Coemansia sp. Benny D115]
MVPASKRLALIPSSEELPFELNGTVALDDYIVFHDGKLSDFLNSTTMAAVIEADNNRTTSGETELEQMMRIRKSILEEEVEEDEEVIKFEIESKDGGELTSRLGEFRKKKIPNPFFLFRQFLVTCVARYNGMLPATRISEYSRTLKSGHDVIKDAYLKDKKQEKKKARKQSNASTAKKDAPEVYAINSAIVTP